MVHRERAYYSEYIYKFSNFETLSTLFLSEDVQAKLTTLPIRAASQVPRIQTVQIYSRSQGFVGTGFMYIT